MWVNLCSSECTISESDVPPRGRSSSSEQGSASLISPIPAPQSPPSAKLPPPTSAAGTSAEPAGSSEAHPTDAGWERSSNVASSSSTGPGPEVAASALARFVGPEGTSHSMSRAIFPCHRQSPDNHKGASISDPFTQSILKAPDPSWFKYGTSKSTSSINRQTPPGVSIARIIR